MKSIIAACFLFPALAWTQGDPVMIRLVDPLDEPEYYCIDIPGFRQNVRLDAPLMAHTLKRFGSADEMFVFDYPAKGQIYAVEYGLCIEAASSAANSDIMLKKPSDSPLQTFSLTQDGALVLANHPTIAVTVADGVGTKAGGPSHLRRDIKLMRLDAKASKRQTWKLVKSADSWPE